MTPDEMEGKEKALKLKQHMLTPPKGECTVRNVRPVKVWFYPGGVYYGVEYDRVGHYTPGERAVTEGGKAAGDEYTDRKYALLGLRGRVMRARKRVHGDLVTKTVWNLIGDNTQSDWYIAGDYEGQRNDWYPLGPEFSVNRWPHENPWHDRIDKYDEHKRDRKQFKVEYMD